MSHAESAMAILARVLFEMRVCFDGSRRPNPPADALHRWVSELTTVEAYFKFVAHPDGLQEIERRIDSILENEALTETGVGLLEHVRAFARELAAASAGAERSAGSIRNIEP